MPFPHAGEYGSDNFVDTAGVPVVAGTSVSIYLRGTTTLATLYSDFNRSGQVANPTTIGVAGNLFFYSEPDFYDALVSGRTLPITVVPYPPDTLPSNNVAGPSGRQILWDTGDLALLGTQIPFTLGQPGNSVPASGWTKTIVAGPGNVPAKRLRLAPPTGTNGNGTRIAVPFVGLDSVDSEIRSLWYGHSWPSPGGGQMGHMHRAAVNPADGKYWGYMVTCDANFGDAVINLDNWRASGGPGVVGLIQGLNVGSGGGTAGQVPGIAHYISILGYQRIGSATTVAVPFDHQLNVGDVVYVSNAIVNEGATLTAVGSTTVSYTSTTSGTVAGGPGGELHAVTREMPYWMATRLVGMTLKFKAWRMESAEPDWADPRYAGSVTLNTGNGPPAGVIGSPCIYGGHLDASTRFVDYGTVRVTPL